ncbi:MAG: NADPH-dependent 2,4-dienoyl-CoA reductase/sulfur reductase-like enzyme [Desulforhopalus sp.]|jgi:NADPH-dependent 2,4-dienoyl-CoA reductase/sulfur reductase-like enzyme/rhodanese-related sulfurtransferase
MEPKKIVVIGGSAAGAKAAAKARRLDQKAKITIIQQDHDLSMASCGYPYYVGGVFDNRNALLATPTGVVRGPEFFQKTKNIKALTETAAVEIDRENKRVLCKSVKTGESSIVEYDKLVYCIGASAKVPPVVGNDLSGVTTLVSMEDTDFLHKVVADKMASHVVVIGGGLIGVEVCEALVNSSIGVTLVEMASDILAFLDPQMSKLAANHMKSKGVKILTETGLECFVGESGKLTGVMLRDGSVIDCQVAVVATGVQPNVKLAADAGLKIGTLGGVVVDEFMTTSDPDIYAAGDCVEVKNLITGQQSLAPMGDLANLQGRVAGENIVLGNSVSFPGTIHTAICKIFDFAAGTTGVSEENAKKSGLNAVETVVNASPDKPGFMGAKLLISKIVIDKKANKIIGYQCVGNGDVSRQLATAAMAIQGGMSLDQLCCADLPYAPPFSLAIDHFIASAHIVQNKIKGRLKTISAQEVMEQVSHGEKVFYLDGRGSDEFEVLRLGIGEHYLPLGALKGRLDELPQDKDSAIVCFCKVSLRGYEAAIVLEDLGYTNVKVMEGGIMAWPYKREM